MLTPEQNNLVATLTANIVCAYVAGCELSTDELVGLVGAVSQKYREILAGTNVADAAEVRVKLTPAVSVKKSVTPEYIICLEDGKRLKMLKRYLSSRYGLTPQQYREKWSLPRDYPMVAPNYQQLRSRLAREHGLGRSADTPAAA